MATITSEEENNFITHNFSVSAAWLGGYQPAGSPEPSGNWQWVNGEAWGYSNWGPGEPNNDLGSENSLIINSAGLWNDGHNWDSNPGLPYYIVEYDSPVPEPSTIVLVGIGVATFAGFNVRSRSVKKNLALHYL